jgi:rhodanese-related sulfurtransferase
VLCRLSLSPETCIRKTEDLYGRWGARSLLFAKFVPGFASIAAPLAGVARTPVATFLCMDGLGVALWAGFAVLIGETFRGAVSDVVTLLERLGQAGLALVVAGLVLFVLTKWVQRRRFFHELKLARISVIELYGLIDDGERPIILDVRPRGEQIRGGRIPGARTASLDGVTDLLDSIDEHEEVIVYCDCPDEAAAARLAKTLMQHGVVRVRPLFGGIEAWRAAGFAVEFD